MDIYMFNSTIQVWNYSISTKISLMLPSPAPAIPSMLFTPVFYTLDVLAFCYMRGLLQL